MLKLPNIYLYTVITIILVSIMQIFIQLFSNTLKE